MTALQLAVYLGLHAAFIWGRYAVFRIDGATPRGVRLIEALATLGIVLGACLIAWRDGASIGFDILALAVAAASGALYAWALRTIHRRQLTAAFSADAPRELIASGPFRRVRHPFYVAYLMSYLQAVLASRSAWALLPLAWMAVVYTVAAWREERKFMASLLAAAYADYASCTGRFLPRLSLSWMSGLRASARPKECGAPWPAQLEQTDAHDSRRTRTEVDLATAGPATGAAAGADALRCQCAPRPHAGRLAGRAAGDVRRR